MSEKRKGVVPRAGPAFVTAVAAGLTFIVAASVTSSRGDKVTLAAGRGFAVSASIATLPDCSTPAVLYPGVPRCLVYTVHNPYSAPIAVNTLGIGAVSAPSLCATDNLDLSAASYSGSFTVPAGGSVQSPAMRITLRDTRVNQDSCKAVTFAFTASGTAVVEPPATRPASEGARTAASGVRQAPPLAQTGADVAALSALGAGALVLGLSLLGSSRRRRARDPS